MKKSMVFTVTFFFLFVSYPSGLQCLLYAIV